MVQKRLNCRELHQPDIATWLPHTQAPPKESGAAQVGKRVLYQQVLSSDQYDQSKGQLQSLQLGFIPLIAGILTDACFRCLAALAFISNHEGKKACQAGDSECKGKYLPTSQPTCP